MTPKANKPTPSVPRFIVGIEAATPAGGVALANEHGQLLAQFWHDSKAPVSQRILADLDTMLERHQAAPEQIAALAVSQGPGSFTGIRVGLTVAKTLAQGWGCALYTYSTLAAMASRWPVPGDVVCALLDARRGEIYSGLYQIQAGGAPQMLRPDQVEPAQDLLADLTAGPWPRIILMGSGAQAAGAQLREGLGERAVFAPPALDAPGAEALALLGAADLAAGRASENPLHVGPAYLRLSDAEKRHGIVAFGG